MHIAREFFTATMMSDGRVLIVGGFGFNASSGFDLIGPVRDLFAVRNLVCKIQFSESRSRRPALANPPGRFIVNRCSLAPSLGTTEEEGWSSEETRGRTRHILRLRSQTRFARDDPTKANASSRDGLLTRRYGRRIGAAGAGVAVAAGRAVGRGVARSARSRAAASAASSRSAASVMRRAALVPSDCVCHCGLPISVHSPLRRA